MMKKTLLIFLIFFMTSFSANSATQRAILAGGCFWGMEELIAKLNGVTLTKVGYTGGNIDNPNYEIVSSGLSGHAEAIEILFNDKIISYEQILKFFFTIHDPTQINRQQNDIGSQYRSEIFYLNDDQKETAAAVIRAGNSSGVFKKPIATKISKASKFWLAEDYHQKYLEKTPNGYTCHHVREEWKF